MSNSMRLETIVVSAGKGKRLRSSISKSFVKIKEKPILYYTLKILTEYPLIKDIILVIKRDDIRRVKRLIATEGFKRIKKVVAGGKTRRLSVEKGLQIIDSDTDFVLIHDAARPFINQKILEKVILEARRFGAAVCGVPLKSTLKRLDNKKFTRETLDRRKIWEIQTPQVFRKDIILAAYRKFKDKNFTDDSSLVERLGLEVKVVKGDYFNIKITTPEDLVFAEAILEKQRLI